MIKVKVTPEDFVVEEMADISPAQGGNFCVCLLKKRGWNTVDVLKNLSKKFNLPSSDFSYGGKKDKYALTSQYITIARRGGDQALSSNSPFGKNRPEGLGGAGKGALKEVIEKNYSLSFVGYMDRPMGPDLIKGNKFHIVVRNLTENELRTALDGIEGVKKDGYPNYFDDQRFGSFDARQGFVAEKVIKKHYNGALKVYFSRIHPEDSKDEKERRKFLYENWGNWQACLTRATDRFGKEAFSYLEKHPDAFVPVLQRISHEEMVLFFSAYQSHLWNEVLRKIIQSVVNHDLKVSRGIAGNYLFYAHLDKKNKEYLSRLVIPMPASSIRMSDTLTETLYSEVLRENGLRSPMFNIKKIRQAFFKGIERNVVVIPEELSVAYADDEIYQGKKKLVLDFFLPRGCFGTMFIKRIFS